MCRSIIAVFLATCCASVSAQGFDYDYLQLSYNNIEFDEINVDGDGFGISGSFSINPDWHVFAGYQGADLDFGVDATSLAAGIGYNTDLTAAVDLVGRISYEYIELDASGAGSVDDNGFGLGIGLRFAASTQVELNAGIDYIDFGDGGDDTALSAAGLYSLNDAFSISVGGSWSDDVSSYMLAGRFYFE